MHATVGRPVGPASAASHPIPASPRAASARGASGLRRRVPTQEPQRTIGNGSYVMCRTLCRVHNLDLLLRLEGFQLQGCSMQMHAKTEVSGRAQTSCADEQSSQSWIRSPCCSASWLGTVLRELYRSSIGVLVSAGAIETRRRCRDASIHRNEGKLVAIARMRRRQATRWTESASGNHESLPLPAGAAS